jgi:hypothetical protein
MRAVCGRGGLRSLVAAAGLLLSASSQAWYGGLWITEWDPDYAGHVVDAGERLSFDSDLGLRPRRGSGFRLSLGHEAARIWWPEAVWERTPLRASGEGSLRNDISLGPIVLLPGTTRVISDVDLRDDAVLLRWPITLGRMSWSPGLALRSLSGDIDIVEDGGSRRRERVSAVAPMVYLAAATASDAALMLELDGSYVRYGGDRGYDWRASLWWNALKPFSAGLAWQVKRYDLSTSGVDINARISGPRLLLGLRW